MDEKIEDYGTDKYFVRTVRALEEQIEEGELDPGMELVAEITMSLPHSFPFGVLGGVNETLDMYEGENVTIRGMEEGEIFFDGEPVMNLKMTLDDYLDLGPLETPTIGYLGHATGISTKAARVRIAAGDRPVASFGSRRVFPEMAEKVERYAVQGGLDSFSNIKAEEDIGEEAVGTMPHALIILNSEDGPNQVSAWKAFDRATDEKVPRIALADTYADEKEEAILAAESIEGLDGVRLDTTGSRRGDFRKIVQEVRWELDRRGQEDVDIFVSGGLDEYKVRELREAADAFGVGTSISTADSADPSYNIVEINGNYVAKRGKLSGEKTVYRNENFEDFVVEKDDQREDREIFRKLVDNGERKYEEEPLDVRDRVLGKLEALPDDLRELETGEGGRVNYS